MNLMTRRAENCVIVDSTATEEIEEIKVGVEEKKKTQGMRRDLGHKGCGRWEVTSPQVQSLHHFSW